MKQGDLLRKHLFQCRNKKFYNSALVVRCGVSSSASPLFASSLNFTQHIICNMNALLAFFLGGFLLHLWLVHYCDFLWASDFFPQMFCSLKKKLFLWLFQCTLEWNVRWGLVTFKSLVLPS